MNDIGLQFAQRQVHLAMGIKFVTLRFMQRWNADILPVNSNPKISDVSQGYNRGDIDPAACD
jgi:hypothetical protein